MLETDEDDKPCVGVVIPFKDLLKEVQNKINDKTSPFNLLFLNFCHSNSLAKKLIETNVAKHIICIDREINDFIAK